MAKKTPLNPDEPDLPDEALSAVPAPEPGTTFEQRTVPAGPSTANQVPPPGNDPDVNTPHGRDPSVDSSAVNFVTPDDVAPVTLGSNVDETPQPEPEEEPNLNLGESGLK